MQRRDFLRWLGLSGVAGASTITPMPGSILDLNRSPKVSRERATDSPMPKEEYGLRIRVDKYQPNQGPERIYFNDSASPRAGETELVIHGWIDEDAYGMKGDSPEALEARREFAQSLATTLVAITERMEPAMRDLRRRALDRKLGTRTAHRNYWGGHNSSDPANPYITPGE